MSSKRHRLAARRAKGHKTGRRRSTAIQGGVSSAEAGIERAYERFAGYIQSANSFEEAASLARVDLRSAVDEVAQLACGLDLITVVSSVYVSMILDSASGGGEPWAALLEVIALVLAWRDASGSGATPDRSEFMPPNIQAAARKAFSAGSMIQMFDTPPSNPEAAIIFHSVQREITLRNPAYPHMLLDTMRGLFEDLAVNDDCRAVLGFTGAEAVEVMEGVRSLVIGELTNRFRRMEAARDASIPLLRSPQRGDEDESQPSDELRAAARAVVEALEGLTTDIADATMIDPSVVAQQTGIEISAVQSVLDAFTLTRVTKIDEALDRFFHGDNPLRTAPIVRDAQGRLMLVHEALALPAVREVIETRLKAAKRQAAYIHHRGEWVENSAIDLLVSALPGSTVYRGFNYFVPDPTAATPQTDPSKFTKRVEADGLILIDDVALIIEVKSVALTAEARGGVAGRLRGKLRDIVTEAASQADRLRERMVLDRRIRLDDDQWIDASGVREIHTIAVGLEDLSGVTTATAMLVAAGILSAGSIPWTVSVHDLRIVVELLDRPSELLLYLRRRTHPEATLKYRAVDELDLFLLFLDRGLYVEPDPHQVERAFLWSGPPSTAELRRFAAQRPGVVASHTEPLDAWYASQLSPAAPQADKPKLAAEGQLLQLVDQIIETRAPGWLTTTTWLLEGNADLQRRTGQQARKLAKMVREDGRRHSATHLIGDPSGNSVLLVWVCLGRHEDIDEVASESLRYLLAKKHQIGAYQAACMLFDRGGEQMLRLLYDNRQTGPDAALDAEVARLGLIPIEKMRRA